MRPIRNLRGYPIVPVLLLILCSSVYAAMEQSYVMTMDQNGNSVITKDMDLSLYADLLPPGSFQRMSDVCAGGFKTPCSVDAVKRTVHMQDTFSEKDGYYSFKADYGFPSIRYVVTVNSLPIDRFGYDLDSLLSAANATKGASAGTIRSLELNADNSKTAAQLAQIGTNISYTIVMPDYIDQAPEGTVNGKRVVFDVVTLMGREGPVTVASSELNFPYLLIAFAAIVVAGLAVSFMGSNKERKGEERGASRKRRG